MILKPSQVWELLVSCSYYLLFTLPQEQTPCCCPTNKSCNVPWLTNSHILLISSLNFLFIFHLDYHFSYRGSHIKVVHSSRHQHLEGETHSFSNFLELQKHVDKKISPFLRLSTLMASMVKWVWYWFPNFSYDAETRRTHYLPDTSIWMFPEELQINIWNLNILCCPTLFFLYFLI